MTRHFFLYPPILGAMIFATPLYADKVTPGQAKEITTAILGPRASVMDDKYVVWDFDGDGKPDLAIMAAVDDARPDLPSRKIRIIDLDGKQSDVSRFGKHCAGLLLVPDYAGLGRTKIPPQPVPALAYACYSGFNVVSKQQKIPSEPGHPAPPLIGDGIVLDMETGASVLFYWNGKEFDSFQLAAGD